MPKYVSLVNLTSEGIKDIKNAPKRIESARKGIEALGGKMTAIYSVIGEYDYVVITEFPNDEAGMTFLLTLGAMGNVRTTTLTAFTESEFADIVRKLP